MRTPRSLWTEKGEEREVFSSYQYVPEKRLRKHGHDKSIITTGKQNGGSLKLVIRFGALADQHEPTTDAMEGTI